MGNWGSPILPGPGSLVVGILVLLDQAVLRSAPPELLEKALSSPSRHAWGSSSWKDPNSGEAHRKDADDFLNRLEEENNRYWQKVARWIDEFARWVIPPVYIVVLAVMLGTADYREPKGLISGPTYEGYKSDPLINITAPGANS